jgi:prolyl-tRNA synthetase
LLGLPWRVTVGEKKLAVGQVEIKRRGAADASDVAIETAAAWLADRRGRKSPEAVPA